MAAVLAAVLVGVGVFVALAVRRGPRVALAGVTVLVPLGLAVGIGGSGFTDEVLNDPSAEAIAPQTHRLETVVYSCPPPFADQPVHLGWGLKEPVCTDDARSRQRIALYLFLGAVVSSLALLLSRSLGRPAEPVTGRAYESPGPP